MKIGRRSKPSTVSDKRKARSDNVTEIKRQTNTSLAVLLTRTAQKHLLRMEERISEPSITSQDHQRNLKQAEAGLKGGHQKHVMEEVTQRHRKTKTGLSSSGLCQSSEAESVDECGSDTADAFNETETSDRDGMKCQERDNQEMTTMHMDNDNHIAEYDADAPAHTDSRPMLKETNAQTNQQCLPSQSDTESTDCASRAPQTSKKDGEAAIKSLSRGRGLLERVEPSAKPDVNDDSSSDESDVDSDFAEEKDDEVEVCSWTTHPFSDDDEHTEGTGTEKERYKWKLSYTRNLLQKSPWKVTENSADKYRSRRGSKKGTVADSHMVINRQVNLTRMDGQSFPLMKDSGCLFHVLFEMTGLELIYVKKFSRLQQIN